MINNALYWNYHIGMVLKVAYRNCQTCAGVEDSLHLMIMPTNSHPFRPHIEYCCATVAHGTSVGLCSITSFIKFRIMHPSSYVALHYQHLRVGIGLS